MELQWFSILIPILVILLAVITKRIIPSLVIGLLSGGIKGFSAFANRYVKTSKGALLTVWLVTPFTFIDCCFHAISAGTIGKALIDKVKGDKRKLAVVVNVTSCLLIILIPFGTTYIGYIMG